MTDSANTSPAAQQGSSLSYAEQIRQRRMARRNEADTTDSTKPQAQQEPQAQARPQEQVQPQPQAQQQAQPQPKSQPQPQYQQPIDQQNQQAQQNQQYYQQQEQYYAGDINIPGGAGLEQSFVAPGMYKPLQEEVVLEWQAPSRPHKKKNRQFYSTVAIIALLVSLILFFAGQFLPIAVVISIAFLVYVLSVIPPQKVINRITTHGIRVDEAIYYWEEMGLFWFTKKFDQTILNVEVARFPGRLSLLLGEESKERVEMVLSDVLLQGKPKMTAMEKSADWLQKKIPLDTD